MKTTFFSSLLIGAMMIACNGNCVDQYAQNEQGRADKILQVDNQQNNQLLNGIEQKVMQVFVQAKIEQNDNLFESIENHLLSINSGKQNPIVNYWYAYTCYYHAISCTILQNPKKSEQMLDKGIEMLENTEHKSSEHFALLGLMTSFSFQFASGFQAPFIARKVSTYNEQALSMDSTNLRAWFVSGSSDFYTPEKYGGGKKAEFLLKKAISLSDQTIKNPYLPSWGRNQTYELLIRLYIRQKNNELAVQYYKQAHALFPDDYMINKLAGELLK